MITLGTITGATGATAAEQAAKHRKLADAAQQFEAMFLQEMLKPMNSLGTSDGAAEGAGDADAAGQTGTLTSFGTEAVAKAIAAAGGLGIGRHIVAEVEKERARHESKEISHTALKP